jgi:hypothetical protein
MTSTHIILIIVWEMYPYKSFTFEKHKRKFRKLKGAKYSVSKHADALKIVLSVEEITITQILISIFCLFCCFTVLCCTAEFNFSKITILIYRLFTVQHSWHFDVWILIARKGLYYGISALMKTEKILSLHCKA